MKLTAQQEYGLRCLPVFAKEPDSMFTISEIAKREGLSKPYVAKLMRSILKGRLVNSGKEKTEPEKIALTSDGELHIQWPDGHQGVHRSYFFRTNCACAVCIDENSGKRILDSKRVPLDIRLTGFAPVGRYAVSAQFSDGHRTGIYPFKRLRELCECEACLNKKKG